MKKKFNNFKWIRALVYVLIGGAIIFGGGYPFYKSNDITGFLSYASIILVGYAVFVSIKSLQLARNTQRPFLSLPLAEPIPISIERDIVTINFKIQNSGLLPASDVHADTTFYDKDEKVTETNQSNKYPTVSQSKGSLLLFPNTYFYEELSFNLDEKDEMELWENIKHGNVKFRLRITYKNLSRDCITIQTEQIVKLVGLKGLETIPIPPQKWE